ncbi:MAG: DUF166 family (seleno)protein DfsP [Desulfococcaceae bacterium]
MLDTDETCSRKNGIQKIAVFQQNGSGENKIRGIREYGNGLFQLKICSIDMDMPSLIEDGSPYLPSEIEADLVLDYIRHPDLSQDLGELCRDKGIPVVASGKKHKISGVITPPTCCGLSRQPCLGHYGDYFGAPEFEVSVREGKISQLRVLRGAPCGASWEAAARMIGLSVEKSIVRIGLDTQFYCTANPAAWDPMYGHSPVHFAADVHIAALKRALKKSGFLNTD